MDGREPTFAEYLYEKPFPIARAVTIRAVAYDASFNLVPVDLQLANVTVSTNQLWAGDAITISWTGRNNSGAPLLGSWTDGVYLSADNRRTLDKELQETYGESLEDLRHKESNSRTAQIVLRKITLPPLVIRQLVRTVTRKETGNGKAIT